MHFITSYCSFVTIPDKSLICSLNIHTWVFLFIEKKKKKKLYSSRVISEKSKTLGKGHHTTLWTSYPTYTHERDRKNMMHMPYFFFFKIFQNQCKDFYFHINNENKIHMYTKFITIFIYPLFVINQFKEGSLENKSYLALTTLSLQVFILSFLAPLLVKGINV